MNHNSTTRIDAAVAECLSGYDPLHMPFATVDKFIERLKADPAWSEAEITELQTRVIRTILKTPKSTA